MPLKYDRFYFWRTQKFTLDPSKVIWNQSFTKNMTNFSWICVVYKRFIRAIKKKVSKNLLKRMVEVWKIVKSFIAPLKTF